MNPFSISKSNAGPVIGRGVRADSWARCLVAAALFLQPLAFTPASASMPALPTAGLKDKGPSTLGQISFDDNRLLVRLDKETSYRVFSLSRPPRVVIELPQTTHAGRPYEAKVDSDFLKRIRSAQFKTAPDNVARVVLDMAKLVPYQTFKQGNDIVLQFGKGQAAAKPNKSTMLPATDAPSADMLEGEEEATVTATASAEKTAPRLTRRRSKDLLAGLPRNPVTIDFENADIRDVIRVLSEMSGINMIHSSDLTGFLSIHLDQVPFNQAFDTIMTMQGLVPQQMGDNILRIVTPATITADRSRAVTAYKTFTLNYAKASEVQTHLASLRISPNGKITVDDRTNSVVVTDTPEGLSAAERLISDLDQKPQQVMIETKMVEINLDDTMDLGIQWEYFNSHENNSARRVIGQAIREEREEIGVNEVDFPEIGTTLEGEPAVFQNAALPLAEGLRGTGVNLPGQAANRASITFGFINNSNILSATLNALATKGLTKVLSSPKIITLNNRQARIQVGDRIPYQTVNISASGVAQQSVTYVDVGIILTVTPTINADNRIRLNVRPEVSIPGNVTVAGAAPPIQTRNAETEVLIRDGETLVIGGLIDEQTRQSASKVPLLGDIPVLGVFFRTTHDEKSRSELLVFVTPRVIRE